MSGENLQRFTVPGAGRVYTDGENIYPSVTTVIGQKDEPEGLKRWKEKYDGKDGTKHWKDIRDFKGYRGTLVHYELLNQIADEEQWGKNEEDAMDNLRGGDIWARSTHEVERDPMERAQEGVDYALGVWSEIKAECGIEESSILDVEYFVTNDDIGYGGQFDLLYLDDDYNVTLCDLKTSARVYDKQKMQLSAYKNALDMGVDKAEVVRIHPDSETYEISSNHIWKESIDQHWSTFKKLRKKFEEETSEEHLQEILEEGVDDG